MATLRNKTTSSGVIVRWVPHPTHSRPSTYQVRRRAVNFLAEIGYAVPYEGDEVEIPWDVCRPLRILGDLHFKSETKGHQDIGQIQKVSETYGQSLSNEQQSKLRSYIETHEAFQDQQQELEGELDHLPRLKERHRPGGEEPESTSARLTSFIKAARGDLLVGKAKGQSNSGNTHFKASNGTELSIGPVRQRKIPERVLVWQLSGDRGICLHEQAWTANYIDYFEPGELSPNGTRVVTSEFQLNELAEYLQALTPHSDQLPPEIRQGPKVIAANSITETLAIGWIDQHCVWVKSPCTLQDNVTVEVIGASEAGIHARSATSDTLEQEYTLGDALEPTIVSREESTTWGLYEETLVKIPAEVPEWVTTPTVGISEFNDRYIQASVDDLSDQRKPSPGSEVEINDGELVNYSGIPVDTGTESPKVWQYTAEVTEVSHGQVITSIVPRAEGLGLNTGDEIVVDTDVVNDGSLWGALEDIPVTVEADETLVAGAVRATVTEVSQSHIHASFNSYVTETLTEDSPWTEAMTEGLEQLSTGAYDAALEAFKIAENSVTPSGEVWKAEAKLNQAITRAERARSAGQVAEACDQFERLTRDLSSDQQRSSVWGRVEIERTAYLSFIRACEAKPPRDWSLSRNDYLSASVAAKEHLKAAGTAYQELDFSTDSQAHSHVHPVALSGAATIVEELRGASDEIVMATETLPQRWCPILHAPPETILATTHPDVVPFHSHREPSERVSRLRTEATSVGGESELVESGAKLLTYANTQAIASYVHARSEGVCEACGNDAAFEAIDGTPHLELHHVDELTRSGPLTPARVVALCPTCHARIHYGADGEAVNEAVRSKLTAGLGELGAERS
ncbi:HNH endonuclease signature motif containing protein [Halobaculum rubrum]|uniref:HNH endonuclease signature motif containing protein n=1 Tax=Halobaculum rubrum TaxID=2872158 RepID=UPI001CA39914|nr:HNH endonuclease signature motif containing protein [Halobaculum rubrum]QZY01207.1 HNH endonuclease [Halobaculum rubrum]